MEDWIQGSHVTSKFQNTQPWCVSLVFSSCTNLLFVGMGLICVAVVSFPRTWETRECTKLEKGKIFLFGSFPSLFAKTGKENDLEACYV